MIKIFQLQFGEKMIESMLDCVIISIRNKWRNQRIMIRRGEYNMRATIDRDGCISCGLCETICSNVFRMADDGLAEVYVEEIPENVENCALEAQDSCPAGVISVEE